MRRRRAGDARRVSRGRRRLASAFGLLLVLAGVATAGAHADVPLVDGTLALAPGASHVVPLALHYHRIVARYAVEPATATGVTLFVRRSDPTRAAGPVPSGGGVLYGKALRGEGRNSQLIACCDGVAYAPMELELRNDGDAPVTLDVRAWAVHDEFAVLVARAEPGALEAPLALFAGLGVAAAALVRRERRRLVRSRHAHAGLPATFWGSAGLAATGVLVVAALGVAGALRYGGGPVDGLIAIMADVPVPGGPFGSRAALLLGVLLLAWVAAVALWLACLHQGAHRASPWPARLGVALAFVSLGGGLALVWTYGLAWSPVLLGTVLAAPLAWAARVAARAGVGGSAVTATAVRGPVRG